MPCANLVESYISYLEKNFEVKPFDRDCLIVTPFPGLDGDHIEVRIFEHNGKIVLTDDGLTLDSLFLGGLNLPDKSTARQYLLNTALNTNRAYLLDNEIAVNVAPDRDPGEALMRLIRAITSIQHLAYTIRGASVQLFKEQVADYLKENQIPFTPDFTVTGKTKDHRFDFVIPERPRLTLIKTCSTGNRSYARRLATDVAFGYADLARAQVDFEGITIVDDDEDVWDEQSLTMLREYSHKLIPWSDRSLLIEYVA